MEKERSDIHKNLLGGLLGGMLGLVVISYLQWLALGWGPIYHWLVTALVMVSGTIIGWWYEDVGAILVSCYRQAKKYGNLFKARLYTCYKVCSEYLAPSFAFLFKWPITLVQWFKKHPMNRAYVMTSLALIFFCMLVYFGGFLVISNTWTTTTDNTYSYWGYTASTIPTPTSLHLLSSVVIMQLISMPVFFSMAAKSNVLKNYYKNYESYSHQGAIVFFFSQTAKYFLVAIKTYGCLLGAILYFAGLGPILATFVLVPLIFIALLAKGLAEIALRPGHWPCLVVVCIMVPVSALVFAPYLNPVTVSNPATQHMVIWGIGLLVGIACGVLAEALRRLLAWSFQGTKQGQKFSTADFADQLNKHLASSYHCYLNGWKKMFGQRLAEMYT